MLNHFQSKRYCHHLQVSFTKLNQICRQWYKQYAPKALRCRRNIKQVKLADSTILALLILQTELGIESQRRFCMMISSISRSRFNRRARQLLPLINLIRRNLNQTVNPHHQYLVIDSFPVPLCQPIRNHRVSIFQGIANVGYNATKRLYFYGFKVHCIVSSDGYVLNYLVTKASIHDVTAAAELIANTNPKEPYLLGDVGYLSRHLTQDLQQAGYLLWTPWRRNMKGAINHNRRNLKQIRRTIESNFALLAYYNAENNRARSLTGFQERLELAILASNLEYCLEKFN